MDGRVEIEGITMVSNKIRVQHGFVAVSLLKEEQEGGIIYTDIKDFKPNGKVIAVGDKSWQGTSAGKLICAAFNIPRRIDISVGELILLPKIGQQRFSIDGKEEFVVVHHEDIKVIFRDNKE